MKRSLPIAVIVLAGLATTLLVAGPQTPEAEKLWHYITLEAPYSGWRQMVQQSEVYPFSQDFPSGKRYRIYVNDPGWKKQAPPYPEGTIIVRESLDKQEQVQTVTVRRKIDGFNPEGGDWFWAVYSPTGAVKQSGKVQGCLGCHRSAAQKDYLLLSESR